MARGKFWLALLFVATFTCLCKGDGAEWKSDAHSTYYTGVDDVSGGYKGNCGYGDLSLALASSPAYGPLFFAGSPLLYQGGGGCGSCYEVRCANSDACSGRSIVVTMTDFCPTEGNLPWCAPDKVHFDLSGYAMSQIVKDVAVGTTPLEYRRVDCVREGPAVVGVVGNPYWMEIAVMNLAKSGTYDKMRIKDSSGIWKDLKRDWGVNFVVNEQLHGSISIQVSDSSSGDMATLPDCIPEDWVSGSRYACTSNYGEADAATFTQRVSQPTSTGADIPTAGTTAASTPQAEPVPTGPSPSQTPWATQSSSTAQAPGPSPMDVPTPMDPSDPLSAQAAAPAYAGQSYAYDCTCALRMPTGT